MTSLSGRVVLFDCDGVLVDSDRSVTSAWSRWAREQGLSPDEVMAVVHGRRSADTVASLITDDRRDAALALIDRYEVEAALDDTNLGRLITIFEELRESSQLIIITHQKRTMEVADALYGVTMRGDGVSTVISQRLGAEV